MMQLTRLQLPSKQPPGRRLLQHHQNPQIKTSLPSTYVRRLIAIKRRARAIWQRTQYPSDKRHYNAMKRRQKFSANIFHRLLNHTIRITQPHQS